MAPSLLLARLRFFVAACASCSISSFASKGDYGEHYPYSDLISDPVSYCYAKIIEDPLCCLDQKRAPDVTNTTVRRFGAGWFCGKDCMDTKKGQRGEDIVWMPRGATCESPRVLWIHGGSWEFGAPDTESYDVLATKLASLAGAIVMMTDYPLSPIGDYYSIMEANLAALRWLSSARFGPMHCPVGGAPLFIAGDSAGGGTAVSLMLKLKIEGGWSPDGIRRSEPEVLPGGQILAGGIFYSPWTNLRCDTPDYYYNAFAKIVDRASFGNKRNASVYVGDLMFRGHTRENLDDFTANALVYVDREKSLLTDPVASPFWSTEKELGGGGIPPLFFSVGGSESIKGDSLILAEKAAFYGAKVHLDISVGMWHDFPMYSEGCGGPEELYQAKRALNRTATFIRHYAKQKLKAAKLGLLWPPSKSGPGSPRTSYIYDLSFKDAMQWYPSTMLHYKSSLDSTEVMSGISNTSTSEDLFQRWFVLGAVVSAATGSLLTVALQAILRSRYASRYGCGTSPPLRASILG